MRLPRRGKRGQFARLLLGRLSACRSKEAALQNEQNHQDRATK
jgi:hypothetical protein